MYLAKAIAILISSIRDVDNAIKKIIEVV